MYKILTGKLEDNNRNCIMKKYPHFEYLLSKSDIWQIFRQLDHTIKYSSAKIIAKKNHQMNFISFASTKSVQLISEIPSWRVSINVVNVPVSYKVQLFVCRWEQYSRKSNKLISLEALTDLLAVLFVSVSMAIATIPK